MYVGNCEEKKSDVLSLMFVHDGDIVDIEPELFKDKLYLRNTHCRKSIRCFTSHVFQRGGQCGAIYGNKLVIKRMQQWR
jgi:hypothetical protein